MNISDFVAGGGDLKSKLSHEHAGVLADGVSFILLNLLLYQLFTDSDCFRQKCERDCERDASNLCSHDRARNSGTNKTLPSTTNTSNTQTGNVGIGHNTGLVGEVNQDRSKMEHIPAERMDQTAFGSRGTRT